MPSRFKLFAPTILAVLVAVCVATWVDYQNSSLILTNSIHENQVLFANEVSHSVARTITGAKRIVATIGKLPKVIEALREYDPSDVQHDVRLQDLIMKVAEENPDFDNISIFASDGNALLDSDDFMTSIADAAFFQTVRKGKAVIDSAIFKRTRKLALFYAMPIMERGVFIGVVRVVFNVNFNQIWPEVFFWETKDTVSPS